MPTGPGANPEILVDLLIGILRVEAVTPSRGFVDIQLDRDVLPSFYRNVMRELESLVTGSFPEGAVLQLSESEENVLVLGATDEIRNSALENYARGRIAKWRRVALASVEREGEALRAEAVTLLAEAETLDKMSPYVVTRISASNISNRVVWDTSRPDETVAAKALGFDEDDGARVFVSWALPVSRLVGAELPDPPDETDDEGDDETPSHVG